MPVVHLESRFRDQLIYVTVEKSQQAVKVFLFKKTRNVLEFVSLDSVLLCNRTRCKVSSPVAAETCTTMSAAPNRVARASANVAFPLWLCPFQRGNCPSRRARHAEYNFSFQDTDSTASSPGQSPRYSKRYDKRRSRLSKQRKEEDEEATRTYLTVTRSVRVWFGSNFKAAR